MRLEGGRAALNAGGGAVAIFSAIEASSVTVSSISSGSRTSISRSAILYGRLSEVAIFLSRK